MKKFDWRIVVFIHLTHVGVNSTETTTLLFCALAVCKKKCVWTQIILWVKSALSRDSGSGSGSGSLSLLFNVTFMTWSPFLLEQSHWSTGVKRNQLFNPTSYKVVSESVNSSGSEQNLDLNQLSPPELRPLSPTHSAKSVLFFFLLFFFYYYYYYRCDLKSRRVRIYIPRV